MDKHSHLLGLSHRENLHFRLTFYSSCDPKQVKVSSLTEKLRPLLDRGVRTEVSIFIIPPNSLGERTQGRRRKPRPLFFFHPHEDDCLRGRVQFLLRCLPEI